jgi:hypothetical protein
VGGYRVSGSYCTGSVPSRASRKYRAKLRYRVAIRRRAPLAVLR